MADSVKQGRPRLQAVEVDEIQIAEGEGIHVLTCTTVKMPPRTKPDPLKDSAPACG